MENIDLNLLKEIADIDGTPKGAYNIRKNGQGIERKITENLEKSFKGCTRVIIAHRLSTVKNADQIIVLRHGRIVEYGTHTELVAMQGYYYELIHNQLELSSEQ